MGNTTPTRDITSNILVGESIQDVAKRMEDGLWIRRHESVSFSCTFNGIYLVATAYATGIASALVAAYHDHWERQRTQYLASEEYRQAEEAAIKRAAQRRLLLEGALMEAPKEPSWHDRAGWEATVQANQEEPYGAATLAFAARWARLMEGRMQHGAALASCVEEAADIANIEVISGTMASMAHTILCQWWIHGDALRAYYTARKSQAQ